MSHLSKITLRPHLLQLKCHFTWKLLEKDCEIDEIEERMYNQLEFVLTENKYMVHNMLGYIKHLKGDYPEAISQLEKAEEIISKTKSESIKKYLVTYGNFAWVYYYTEEYEKAKLYIDKVESIYKELKTSSKDNIELSEIYGEQGWALLRFCAKYYEKAKECFEKALETDKEDPEWNSGYATVVYRLEGLNSRKCSADKCKSLPLLKRAVQLNPQDSVVKALLGLKLQELKQSKEAKMYIEEALDQAPQLPYLLRYVAKFYRKEGMTDEALHVLKRAVNQIPTSGFLHHQIGLCYRQKMVQKKAARGNRRYGNSNSEEIRQLIDNAIFHFEIVIELKKTFVFAYIDLANMYNETKQYDKSEEAFQKVFNMKNLTQEEKQAIHLNYGRFQEYCQKSESKAIHHYKEGLKIFEDTKERQNCEKVLKKLASRKIERDASDASGFALLGFVYKETQNTLDAIECYEKAIKLDPYNEEYLSVLCDLKLTI
ncbi:interferon-induced protein with tetratricopeptide repeats 5-like [Discoglossus pictus]